MQALPAAGTALNGSCQHGPAGVVDFIEALLANFAPLPDHVQRIGSFASLETTNWTSFRMVGF